MDFADYCAINVPIRKVSPSNMIRVSSTEFGRDVGRYQDAALSQTVIVTRDGRDLAVMISAGEFKRLKRRDRQVFATAEAPDDIIETVRKSEMDPRHNHLDELLKDWSP
jgi:PHD/YefM family antitoxin component YafN of YafNO toxin-antitoxin module